MHRRSRSAITATQCSLYNMYTLPAQAGVGDQLRTLPTTSNHVSSRCQAVAERAAASRAVPALREPPACTNGRTSRSSSDAPSVTATDRALVASPMRCGTFLRH